MPVSICIETIILCKPARLKQAKLNYSLQATMNEWRKFVTKIWGVRPFFQIKLGICTSRCCGLHAADVELSYAHGGRLPNVPERKGITTIGKLPWYSGQLSLDMEEMGVFYSDLDRI